MNLLLIGNGGREHALAWKLSETPGLETLYVAPGNAGTQTLQKTKNIPLDVCDIEGLIQFAKTQSIALTLVGPEAPLAKGMVDAFKKEGLLIFGPTQKAAQLESSKTFSKDFMARHHIPTAKYASFTNPELAKAYVQDHPLPCVIKADGLAAGKGVIIAHTLEAAEKAIEDFMSSETLGAAGRQVVIEEFLQGEELSFIVMADGEHCVPFASSQDHKARNEGDKGPNTGGMGAYSPAPVLTPSLQHTILNTVIYPVLEGMKKEGMPYTGFLYAGLMISPEGIPKVLEFNCRLGDPETQPLMMRLKSDLFSLCQKALAQTLHHTSIEWDPRTALGVVACTKGYPESSSQGDVITGLNMEKNSSASQVFLAGVLEKEGAFLTHGGRVLCVTALGENATMAKENAYERLKQIHFNGMYYRNDIGYRAVQREATLTSPS